MFVLNPLPPAMPAETARRFAQAEPATIGHFRHWGF